MRGKAQDVRYEFEGVPSQGWSSSCVMTSREISRRELLAQGPKKIITCERRPNRAPLNPLLCFDGRAPRLQEARALVRRTPADRALLSHYAGLSSRRDVRRECDGMRNPTRRGTRSWL